MLRERLMKIYSMLYDRFGPQGWWPGEGTLEIIIGAILTQNTSWKNVERAIANIRAAGLMDAEKLHRLDREKLAALIRPAGYFNVKAKRLANFLTWLHETCSANPDSLKDRSQHTLRGQLLEINGIGPETADSILLYALEKPVFVVDTYTCRVMARHGLIEPGCTYDNLQQLFTGTLQQDTKLFNEYHALLVCVGKDFCKPKPKCQNCPLNSDPHEIEPF